MMYKLIIFALLHATTGSRNEQHIFPASGKCAEERMDKICICGHHSLKKGWQCSGCYNKFKWGYGCDLDCSEDCGEDGCDFSGNCHPPPKNCKTNDRIDGTMEKKQIYNDRGNCAFCKHGWYGNRCEEPCPTNCADSPEGTCTRGGSCFKCKSGYYGENCTSECPAECPDCVMKDNMTPTDPKKPGQNFLPAGSCPKQCVSDHWGHKCNKPCPENCDKTKSPSCYKENGHCNACQNKKFWEPDCSKPCNEGCEEGICSKNDGTCIIRCNNGFYGASCSEQCPEGTGPEGCARNTALPVSCVSGKYPGYNTKISKLGMCLDCPQNCAEGTCDRQGHCTNGCREGFWGEVCENTCPHGCVGACEQSTGYCHACVQAFTGKKCEDRCHPTCLACKFTHFQTGPNDCVDCDTNTPSFLKGTTCACMDGASPTGEDGVCDCDQPSDPLRVSSFEISPERGCRVRCKEYYREVQVKAEMKSDCVSNSLYKAVLRTENYEQGTCDEGYVAIPFPSSQEPTCMYKGYVDYINEE